ncbi:MAG: hypothetical protein WCG12_01790 [Alcaligenaceae bacterium]
MYSIPIKILQSLPSACPLCGLGARGGDLCAGCAQDLAWPLTAQARCQVCFETLPATAAPSETSETSAASETVETSETSKMSENFNTVKDVPVPAVRCSRCVRQSPAYTSLVAAIEYAYPGDMLIQRFKEGARLAYAGMFARLLWGRLQAGASGGQGNGLLSALVPIPSSQSALKRRGFNPAGELARELARLSGYPLRQEWLSRTRDTNTQKTLNAQARRASVSGLYVCPRAVPRVWIGLVDDVVTTGSTMHTAAMALLSAGAAGVIGIAAAHTPRAWQNGAYD